ncbi:lipopolysaccharide transport periplasmic protein LptA [Campylobacter sp. 9BO]|uniref:lipopolysaccharide transport periplasmic protein LptA n=1 Tax=Campylobacter sp. 9BO TaxID=3424759 RepID=UPI003D35742E
MGQASKVALFVALALLCVKAEQVEISADSFFADENKQVTEFKGNVYIKKGSYDELRATKVDVHFDKNRQPIKYIATGNAKFKIFMREKHYEGSGEVLTYEPAQQLYTLTTNAFLHEIDTDKRVYGEKIVVNQSTGTYNVNSGEKKPVKFIFQIEDKGDKK